MNVIAVLLAVLSMFLAAAVENLRCYNSSLEAVVECPPPSRPEVVCFGFGTRTNYIAGCLDGMDPSICQKDVCDLTTSTNCCCLSDDCNLPDNLVL